jgi:hypothetical protein
MFIFSDAAVHRIRLICSPRPGLTLTQAWTTANALDTKLELDNNIAKGLKAEILTQYQPAKQSKGAKLNLYFKQPNLNARAFFDLLNGPTANFDAVLGHEGFLVGAEGGYDVNKAAITKYSAAVGYSVAQYSAAITASNNLSLFSASYYHRVNAQVEAGAKASWDSTSGNAVGLEVASKYRLDPSSFAKVSFKLKRLEFVGITTNRAIFSQFRPRSTTVVLPLWLTTSSSAPVSLSASVPPSIPRTSTRLPTRSAPASPSRLKRLNLNVLSGIPRDDIPPLGEIL